MWTGTTSEVNLYLIRHGATKSNLRHAYLGKTDEALSDEGRQQIEDMKNKKCYPDKADILFCSPMIRCKQTANLIYPDTKQIVIDEWREIDFGRFEGKTYSELNGDEQYQRWIDSNAQLPFPNGESRDEFIKRTMSGLEQCATFMKKGIKTAVAAVHGGTIMAIISSLTGKDYYTYQVKNADGYMLTLILSDKIQITKLRRLGDNSEY